MTNTSSTVPDFHSLAAGVELSDAAIAAAIRSCQGLADEDAQWSCYLRSLALHGLKAWLDRGATPYHIQFNDQISPDPGTAMMVNRWSVGVVPVGSLPAEVALIPRSRLVAPHPIQLWVWIEVLEELGEVRIGTGITSQDILAGAGTLTADHYAVPLTAFTLAPDRLLLYVSHLEPLEPETALAPASPPRPAIMNLGRWLQNQLDEVAQQFAWTLLDPLTPAVALRSPRQELEAIVTELTAQAVTIPPRARAGYTDIEVAAVPLRLYTLVWSVLEADVPEWSLLVFLGAAEPGENLPAGLTLRVRDATVTLAEQTFSDRTPATYLYAQVFGTWEEQFWVDIVPPGDRPPLNLPAFGFQPNA